PPTSSRPPASSPSTLPPTPTSTPFPYTTLFRSGLLHMFHHRIGDFKTALACAQRSRSVSLTIQDAAAIAAARCILGVTRHHMGEDRKSTRLNSSHQIISYAVFCLKKKQNHSAAT